MAEQDEPQTGKPGTPATAPAVPGAGAKTDSAPGPLSAAAASAAAKIEASLVASRAAAAQKAAEAKAVKPAATTGSAPAGAPAKPAQAPAATTTTAPAKADPAPPKPADTAKKTPAPASSAEAGGAKDVPAKPAAQPKAEEPEEVEDIIAKIPVEPHAETTKFDKPAAPAGYDATAAQDKTRAMPRPVAPATPQTASAIAEARSRVFGAYTPVPEPTPAARERRAAREAALEAKPPLARTLQVLLAIAYPFVLLILAIRLVASPVFLWIAYQRPGFPADGFGFTTADRLTYGSYGVDFLNNVADNRYLGELRDPNGNPLFLGTEVQHMADVKLVMSFTYLGGVVLGVIALIALAYLGKRYAGGIRRGLFAGSVATLVLLAGLTTLAILGWESFFTTFHRIFFANGTWTFNYSDTLIRLYPPQFWIDAAIGIAGLVVITALVTLFATWPTAKRREGSRLRQEKRVFGL